MMRKSKVVVAIIAMVALLAIAAACGEDATPTPQPATAVPAPTVEPSAPAPTAVPSAPLPTPVLPPGSPPPPALSGSPGSSLTFDGVGYVHSGYAELPSGEGTVFVIDGSEIDLDDLEMVGTTYEGNTPGISEGLQVYRSTVTGDANAVYTFTPGQSIVNPEDGQIFEFAAVWTRWAASSN